MFLIALEKFVEVTDVVVFVDPVLVTNLVMLSDNVTLILVLPTLLFALASRVDLLQTELVEVCLVELVMQESGRYVVVVYVPQLETGSVTPEKLV